MKTNKIQELEGGLFNKENRETNKIKEEIEILEEEIKDEKGDEYLEGYFFTDEEVSPMLRLECLKARLEERKQATADFIKKIDEWIKQFFRDFPLTIREEGLMKEYFKDLKQMLVEKD